MAEIVREPGLNSGLPEQDGLDDGTRAAIQRTLEKGKPVVVGGVQDFQKFFGDKALDDSEETVNLPPGETAESVITTAEHDAATPGSGPDAAAVTEDNTKEEIQAALDERGIEYNSSDTKQELLDRLNA